VAGLYFGLDLGSKVSQLVSRAVYRKAEIIVDANKDLHTMPKPFNNIARRR